MCCNPHGLRHLLRTRGGEPIGWRVAKEGACQGEFRIHVKQIDSAVCIRYDQVTGNTGFHRLAGFFVRVVQLNGWILLRPAGLPQVARGILAARPLRSQRGYHPYWNIYGWARVEPVR